MPFAIDKAKNPMYFKKFNTQLLPVKWESNRKAWMTSDVMSIWLLPSDKKIHWTRRKILLFLDNAASHSQDLNLKAV